MPRRPWGLGGGRGLRGIRSAWGVPLAPGGPGYARRVPVHSRSGARPRLRWPRGSRASAAAAWMRDSDPPSTIVSESVIRPDRGTRGRWPVLPAALPHVRPGMTCCVQSALP